jgi:hypothetical protein
MTSGENFHLASIAIRIAQLAIEGQARPFALRTPSHWVALKIRPPCARAGVQTSSILGLSRFVPLKMKRRGVETRIIIAAGNEPPRKGRLGIAQSRSACEGVV